MEKEKIKKRGNERGRCGEGVTKKRRRKDREKS